MPVSDCIFVKKREFNGTISSKFLPLPHNYAVSREKMAKINNKSTKTTTTKKNIFDTDILYHRLIMPYSLN